MLLNFVKRQIKKAFRPSIALACDNYALSLLRPFQFEYMPWTAAAIRPASLCALLNEILINRRKTIVEFGAGISTLYIAQTMKQIQGRLISFEHDQDWRDFIAARVSAHGLAEFVEVVHAPLLECEWAMDGCPWYDYKTVREKLAGTVLDGVIVDGPPASSRGLEMARYPAVSVLKDCLGESFFIYLDDIDRPGESQIFQKWEELLRLTGSKELIAGEFGMLRKGSRFAIQICDLG